MELASINSIFTNISFIFLFLPISVIIYYLVSDKYKNSVMLFASLFLYFTISPKYLLVMATSIVFDYAMSFAMKCANQNMKKRAIPLLASIIKNVLLIVVVVYVCKHSNTTLPIGIFVYTFTAMGYIIDVYEGDVPYENSIINFALFCSFFGKIVFGPIATYKEFSLSLKEQTFDIKTITKGGISVIRGVAKLEIISFSMFSIYAEFKAVCDTQRTIIASWGIIFTLAMAVYFLLSGYSDIAVGTANLFGMALPENIVYPYSASSLKEFFATFNKTVSAFFGKYVFLPLGAAKKSNVFSFLNILLMCMLWGVWFGFNMNFALWGIYIGLFICLEQFLFDNLFKNIPTFIGRMYTKIVILLSFAVFGGETLSKIGMNFRGLFDFRKFMIYNNQTIYTLILSFLPTILSLIFITKFPKKFGDFFRERLPRTSEIIITSVNIALLFFTMGYMLY